MTLWSKEKTLQFIELYRAHECLWRVKCKDYSNKMKRERSYEELTNFVKSFYPDANKDTVIGKISKLRGSWRKEYKKMTRSQISGSCVEDFYEPGLFYFENLRFILDSEVGLPRKRREISRLETDNQTPSTSQDDSQFMSDKDDDSQVQTFKFQDGDIDIYDDQPSNSSTPYISAIHSTPGGITMPVSGEVPRKKKVPVSKRKRVSEEDNLLLLACQKLNAPSSETVQRDEYDSFGQTVAHDLRSMSRHQFIHAKKLISDVLYEGQLGNLTRVSSVLTVPDTRNSAGQYPYTPTSSNVEPYLSRVSEV